MSLKNKNCLRCFSLVGQATRLRIIKKLKEGTNNVSGFDRDFKLTQPTISYHLGVLRKNNIVLSKRAGRKVFYFLNQNYPCQKCFILKIPFRI